MRSLILIPLLGALTTGFIASDLTAAESVQTPQTESADTIRLTKAIALAIEAIKIKTGAYPASATLMVTLNGSKLEMVTTVTGFPESFSFKSSPSDASRSKCPVTNLSADIANAQGKGLSLESLYATTTNKADVVGFSTSGTEFAVTYTLDNKNVPSTESTLIASDGSDNTKVAAKVTPAEFHISTSSNGSTGGNTNGSDATTETQLNADDVMVTLEEIRRHNNFSSSPAFTSAQTIIITVAVSPEAP